ncbi:HAD-IIA family hydrolase [Bacillus sp. JCM 19034]|uniref:HAD-IIA family hydrolase n=1 Tax=Bacillus sp. JCM 19034 TaxID=1481928 RepID=UPI00078180A9|nr:HAD-IIA family hydrolase [Bacillus sp. JCM 19034]
MNKVEGLIIDLDGTIYKGNEAIEGSKETIQFLREKEMKFVFLSNRGNISRRMCKQKLKEMGIDVNEEEILLTSSVAASYLKASYPKDAVWFLGGNGLKEELELENVTLAKQPERADWLLITLHEELTYHDLNLAFRAVRNGAKIMATNTDKIVPTADGESIDVAGIIAAIVATTEKEVDVVIGKPSSMMATAAVDTLGTSFEQCLVIGDSLASDISLGNLHGMQSALVLTGNNTIFDCKHSEWKPDFVWDSIENLQDWFILRENEEQKI